MRACSDTLPTLTLVTPPARSLTRTRTRTFGILIPSPRVELSARVIARVQNAARSMPIDSGHHSENIPTTIDASLSRQARTTKGGGGTYVTRAPPSSAHMRSAIRISARCSDAAFVPMFSVLLYLFVMKVLEGHGVTLCGASRYSQPSRVLFARPSRK